VPPAKGLDLLGEWLHGRMHLRRYSIDRRGRAEHIAEASDGFGSLSDAALDAMIRPAADRAALRPDGPGAVDNAFALLREVIRRELGIALHVEQVMGALAMADGAAVEMATGEGKTVTAILPIALLGWRRRGVHVLTVNDYLASRDAGIVAGPLARAGLSVGFVTNATPRDERRAAYDADVTYAADKQVVFDFLRDRLVSPADASLTGLLLDEVTGGPPAWRDRVVQRGLYAAVVDEADSVLIDEAVTPAIIAADPTDDGSEPDDPGAHHRVAASLAGELTEGEDYRLDRRARHVELTEAGLLRIEEASAVLPAFWAGRRRREELLRVALIAKELMIRGDDYVVRSGTVEIVDRSTGRVLEGRRWQLGLHQAVEAKEGLPTSDPRRTSSRTSYARFFQRYDRLCGMSGTLAEVRDELWRTYKLPVVRIPTHRPVTRTESPDVYHADEAEKFAAVVDRVAEVHATGRPVLVGTRSVTASERIGSALAGRGVPHRVLNAEREPEEAEIVAEAGRIGAVTVATNMAGRGTDIKLEPGARAPGGLLVIGTERHPERRVDRQLVGRAGRQGDPGGAEMHVCFDDELIRGYGLLPLIGLAKRFPALRPLLWRQAQATGSSRARWRRGAAAAQESWLELSIHTQAR
jgi:preprotein translocase subunit SecA